MEVLGWWALLAVIGLAVPIKFFNILRAPWRAARWRSEIVQRGVPFVDQALAVVKQQIASWPERRLVALAYSYADSRDAEALLRVRGLGPKTLQSLRSAGAVSVGAAFQGGEMIAGIGPVLAEGIRHERDGLAQQGLSGLRDGSLGWTDTAIERQYQSELDYLKNRVVALEADRVEYGELSSAADAHWAERRSQPRTQVLVPYLRDVTLTAIDPAHVLRSISLVLIASLAFYAVPLWFLIPYPESATEILDWSRFLGLSAAALVFGYQLLLADHLLAFNARRPMAANLPEQRLQIHALALAERAGVVPPEVLIREDPSYNAFAVGSRFGPGRIVIHSGLIQHFPEGEVVAILGHEMTHLRNEDCRALATQSFVNALLGVLSTVLAWVTSILMGIAGGALAASSRRRKNSDGGAIALLFFVMALGSFGAYCVTRIMAASAVLFKLVAGREDEYRADEGSVEITGDRASMVSALDRLNHSPPPISVPTRLRHAFIEDPTRQMGGGTALLETLIATHPSLNARVRRLEQHGVAGAGRVVRSWIQFALVVLVVGAVFGWSADIEAQAQSPAPEQTVIVPVKKKKPVHSAAVMKKRCKLWGYNAAGEPVVVAMGEPGQSFRFIAADDKSTAVRMSDGTKAWIPNSCL